MLNNLPLIGTAYIIIVISIIIKTFGLYFLTSKKDMPIQERKKVYSRFNWPANILLAIGVIILAIKWYM